MSQSKKLYWCYDKYLGKKIYLYAYSLNQAGVLFRRRLLSINGKYDIDRIELANGKE